MAKERLQKLIAMAGICSRRKAEALISGGRVKVDGKVVTELGTKADPARSKIEVDDKTLEYEKKVYYVLYKPAGYITSKNDEAGRPIVFDLIPEQRRLVSVGRLDWDTEGVLLMTNDGDLVHGLTHPSRQVPKEYEVKVKDKLTLEQIERIGQGVLLEDGKSQPTEVNLVRKTDQHTWYELMLTEGRNREVKRIIEAVGGRVLKLKRVAFAGINVDNMKPGDSRVLSVGEVLSLYEFAGLVEDAEKASLPKTASPKDASLLKTKKKVFDAAAGRSRKSSERYGKKKMNRKISGFKPKKK